jgi:hypothetical protein
MSEIGAARGEHAPSGVAAAREALLAWVAEAGGAGRVFLEAHLLATGPDRYRLRHRADAARPAAELELLSDPYAARDIARFTAAGEHRPLRTTPNLRRGWSFEELDGAGLWIALDSLYPACAVHWHAGRTGTLRVTHWSETAARQSGIYSAVGLLPEAAMHDAVRACCGNTVCLRSVEWRFSEDAGEWRGADLAGDAAMEVGDARVPCPEACSLFISFARAVLQVEREPRREVPGLGLLSAGEMEQLRGVVDALASGGTGGAREGEFHLPTNPRRVRYLAARLATAHDEEQPGGASPKYT